MSEWHWILFGYAAGVLTIAALWAVPRLVRWVWWRWRVLPRLRRREPLNHVVGPDVRVPGVRSEIIFGTGKVKPPQTVKTAKEWRDLLGYPPPPGFGDGSPMAVEEVGACAGPAAEKTERETIDVPGVRPLVLGQTATEREVVEVGATHSEWDPSPGEILKAPYGLPAELRTSCKCTEQANLRGMNYDGFVIRDCHVDGLDGGWCLIGKMGQRDFAHPMIDGRVVLLEEPATEEQWEDFRRLLERMREPDSRGVQLVLDSIPKGSKPDGEPHVHKGVARVRYRYPGDWSTGAVSAMRDADGCWRLGREDPGGWVWQEHRGPVVRETGHDFYAEGRGDG